MNNSANALLALGASPAMVHSSDEVEAFVTLSQALVVNIGTLYSETLPPASWSAIFKRRQSVYRGCSRSGGGGAIPYRRAAAIALARVPDRASFRGNGSQILTLAQRRGLAGQGDQQPSAVRTRRWTRRGNWPKTAARSIAVMVPVDYVPDGSRVVEVHNGHPLMTRVTGLGCSATAVIGAFMAVETDALAASWRRWRCSAWPGRWRRSRRGTAELAGRVTGCTVCVE